MLQTVAEFTKARSNTRYKLEISNKDDLATVITQFKLDLPDKCTLDQIKLRRLNQIDPKSDPVITGTEFVKALKLLKAHPPTSKEFTYFYVAKKQLTSTRLRNIFSNDYDLAENIPVEVEIKPFWFYFTNTKISNSANESENEDDDKTASQTTNSITTIIKKLTQDVKQLNTAQANFKQQITNAQNEASITKNIQDFEQLMSTYYSDVNTLKTKANKLNKENIALRDGAKSYQAIVNHSDETNILLTKQNEELTISKQEHDQVRQAQISYLKKHYAKYLNTETNKINFLISILNNLNSPMVLAMTKGQSDKLWNLIKAVCDYD